MLLKFSQDGMDGMETSTEKKKTYLILAGINLAFWFHIPPHVIPSLSYTKKGIKTATSGYRDAYGWMLIPTTSEDSGKRATGPSGVFNIDTASGFKNQNEHIT